MEQSGAAAEEEEGESQRKLEEFIRYIKARARGAVRPTRLGPVRVISCSSTPVPRCSHAHAAARRSIRQRHKVVQLEALAHEFGMRASDAVSRVQALEQSGRLTGVMDDRGKYIYVTEVRALRRGSGCFAR